MESISNQAREQRILAAAAQPVVQFGYDKTTVSDIARQAAVSKGAIYLHFKTKEDLFETLLTHELRSFGEKWLEIVEADPEGGTIARLYRNMLQALETSPLMTAMLREDAHVFGNYLRRSSSRLRSHHGRSTRHEFIAKLQKVGAIRKDIDPKITAHIMNMLSYGLVSMHQIMAKEDVPPSEAVIDVIAEIMDRALTPEGGGNSEAGKRVLRSVWSRSEQDGPSRN